MSFKQFPLKNTSSPLASMKGHRGASSRFRGRQALVVSTLLDAAEKRGFDRFVATIAADNSIIGRLLDRFGRVVASHTSLGVSELVFVRRRNWGNAPPAPGSRGSAMEMQQRDGFPDDRSDRRRRWRPMKRLQAS